MFKCTGMCSSCKKCINPNQSNSANDKKKDLLFLPDDFTAQPNENGYGIAFDIGTTTVVGMLWDFKKSKLLFSASLTNPQIIHGADVISRIAYASDENGLKKLQELIINCLNEIVVLICDRQNIAKDSIKKAVACGNTTMSHLLLGINPKGLSVAPFTPSYSGTVIIPAEKTGLHIGNKGTLTVLPNIAGHVGSDITCGILASRLQNNKGLSLFVDIGTNGEIALFNGERLMVCSAAAGPAFEGASITQGMRAADGAIEHVQIVNNEVEFTVIGNVPPVGICGSGLMDIVSELLRHGIIDRSGRMLSTDEYEKKYGKSFLSERITEDENGRKFIIVEKSNSEDIVITQKDIREVQLSKAAISAGINTLMKKADCCGKTPERIFLAGAFGNYIDKNSAVTLGLLPNIPNERIIPIGNSAGTGALMVLTSLKEQKNAELISETAVHINLSSEADFQNDYLNEIVFDNNLIQYFA